MGKLFSHSINCISNGLVIIVQLSLRQNSRLEKLESLISLFGLGLKELKMKLISRSDLFSYH